MRAALYFAPPADHPLTQSASRWLGRDAWTDSSLPRDGDREIGPDELAALTAEPRGYGFHATLKPPFRFSDGSSLDALRGSLADFCRDRSPIRIPALALARLGSFFALVPAEDVPALAALAGDVVRQFDRFRAPLTEAEIARRRPDRLTERQRALLSAWGYPHVFEEFRFHMTLTGPVPEERWNRIESLLRSRFAGFIGRPLAVDTLCIFVQPRPHDAFVVDTAIPLAGRGA
jgi:putative phosphonate metabolism protein